MVLLLQMQYGEFLNGMLKNIFICGIHNTAFECFEPLLIHQLSDRHQEFRDK